MANLVIRALLTGIVLRLVPSASAVHSRCRAYRLQRVNDALTMREILGFQAEFRRRSRCTELPEGENVRAGVPSDGHAPRDGSCR